MATGRIRIGIGGWSFPPWRGTFYPEGLAQARELAFASRALETIEINGTFYRSQKPETFAAWRAATPEGFVFALKAPRYATNRRVLAEAGDSIERFVTGGLAELGDRLGPINWQFAATKRYEPADMTAFLDLLPGDAGGLPLRHALEVRHPSFADPGFLAAARDRGIAVVLAGDSAYPEIEGGTQAFVYARIMGTEAGHPAGYPDAALERWAERARGWAAAGRDVWLYVIAGEKALNPAAAQALHARLAG